MGLSTKNLISKIKTELIADSDVTGMLAEGADGVKPIYNEEYSDLDQTMKPFINIMPMGQEEEERHSNKRKFENTIRVEYIEAIRIYDEKTDFLDRVQYVKSVIYGSALADPAFGTSRSYKRENTKLDYDFTDKLNIAIFTLTYGYYESI